MSKLLPDEVRSVRKLAGLTQAEFAQKLNVGIASVKRWETGIVVQHKAADVAIRKFEAALLRRRSSR